MKRGPSRATAFLGKGRFAAPEVKKEGPGIFRSPCVEESLTSVDLELVIHREGSRYAVRAHPGDDLVTFVVYVSQQRNVPVFHDDTDRGIDPQGVPLHGGISIDASVELRAQTRIEEREGKHLDLIIDALDTFDAFRRLASLIFHDWLGYLAAQRHRSVGIDRECHVVEHVAVGQHVQFMLNLLFNSCGSLLLRSEGALGNKGHTQHPQTQNESSQFHSSAFHLLLFAHICANTGGKWKLL